MWFNKFLTRPALPWVEQECEGCEHLGENGYVEKILRHELFCGANHLSAMASGTRVRFSSLIYQNINFWFYVNCILKMWAQILSWSWCIFDCFSFYNVGRPVINGNTVGVNDPKPRSDSTSMSFPVEKSIWIAVTIKIIIAAITYDTMS